MSLTPNQELFVDGCAGHKDEMSQSFSKNLSPTKKKKQYQKKQKKQKKIKYGLHEDFSHLERS